MEAAPTANQSFLASSAGAQSGQLKTERRAPWTDTPRSRSGYGEAAESCCPADTNPALVNPQQQQKRPECYGSREDDQPEARSRSLGCRINAADAFSHKRHCKKHAECS